MANMVPSFVRPAAVAGTFYPGAPDALAHAVRAMLANAVAPAPSPTPKAIIAPHAGYVYSGPVAASIYARLAAGRGTITRVVLIGPAHRVAVNGLALPGATEFETPLGRVPIDTASVERLARLPQVMVSRVVHAEEHALEVQLPFLQSVLGAFTLVPLAVGYASAEDVAEVLEAVWGGPETLIVVSSDLSHYLPYAEAQQIDRGTAQAIVELRTDLSHDQACGATPVAGLALAAQRHGLQAELVDLRNSGDTAGDRRRVVGYGAFAFNEKTPDAG